MATALLIGTNVWAANTVHLVNHTTSAKTGDYATLQEAVDAILPGDSGTITLLTPVLTLDSGVLIPHVTSADEANKIVARDPQKICIVLADAQQIKMKDGCTNANFAIFKGLLRITGNGSIIREADRNGNVFNRCAIVLTGVDGCRPELVTAENPDRSKQEWSTLYIDNGITVSAVGKNADVSKHDVFAIGINEFGGSVYPNYAGFKSDYLGYSVSQASDGNMWKPAAATKQVSAYGVKVFVDGIVYGTTRGINVVGNINQTPGVVENHTARISNAYPYYEHNYPYIWVGPNAHVSCIDQGIGDNGNGGIYVGGWAVVDIYGEVFGQTGVMMKAGDLKVLGDGKVYSNYPGATASNEGNYHGEVSGSGIFMTSDAAYAGETNVEVTENSTVTGTAGSAIVDVVAPNTTEPQVSHVTVTGGTIEGGKEGAINVTTSTKEQTEVTSGNVEGSVVVNGTTVDISAVIPTTSDYHTTSVTDPETGKTTIVVTPGSGPSVANSVVGATAGTAVKWQNTGVTAETLTSDLTLAELEINENYAQTLTIADGVTLSVGRVVLGANAQIIVEAGAKFIVTNAQGVKADYASNIVLRSSEAKQAYFLFNPAVTSNRHPLATVQLISKSFYEGGKEVDQRFGMPTYDGNVTLTPVNPGSVITGIKTWDYTTDDWGEWENISSGVSYTDAEPFRGFMLASNNAKASPMTYELKGALVGNGNANIHFYYGWNNLANSYSAPIDIRDFMTKVKASGKDINATAYLYRDLGNDTYTWTPVNLLSIGSAYIAMENGILVNDTYPTEIKPMQGFLMQFRTVGETTDHAINYASSVYNPALGNANNAPARDRQLDNKMTVSIYNAESVDNVLLVEGNQFSDDFENGYDAVKYENAASVQLYAMNNEDRMSIVATDNMDGKFLGVDAPMAGNYNLYISGVNGMEYAIVDMLTGVATKVVEGAQYNFFTEAGHNDYRFQIVEANKVATDIEATEVSAAVKGIYTITGQYVGENFDVLPKGAYIVNGVKVIK